MTPKQQAKSLVKDYMDLFRSLNVKFVRNQIKECAKESAIIAVVTMLNELNNDYQNNIIFYWEQVKQEIEAL